MSAAFPILLITPPLIAPNAPYPATPQLAGFLRRHGYDVGQADLSIELLSWIFSKSGLERLADEVRRRRPQSLATRRWLHRASQYAEVVDAARDFLRGCAPHPPPLPRGPRFRLLAELRRARSPLYPEALRDEQLQTSLFFDDLFDLLRDGVDARFGFSRYAERLATTATSFEPLRRALAETASPLDGMLDELAVQRVRRDLPWLMGITVPFPGTLYGALRIARAARRALPTVFIVLGGGYISTELRHLNDLQLFNEVDAMVFDDGELPLLGLAKWLASERTGDLPPRVAMRQRPPRTTLAQSTTDVAHLRHRDRPAPDYSGLPLDRYFGLAETANPMLRFWSERFWNKLMLAHGCYWHRCAFCDTSLDYIARFDPADVATIERWMDEVAAQTGRNEFHFTDEAAPPALLLALSRRLEARGAPFRWWVNVRLESVFDHDAARCLARGGCIAVTAGLECAHDRLLADMGKGIDCAGAAAACSAFASAGILVHLYLMYGYPGQQFEEAVEALEFVRGLFRRGHVHSVYWHRFALTCHSPLYRRAHSHGLRTQPARGGFARNEVAFEEPGAPNWDEVGEVLRRATYNWMLNVALDVPASQWFPPQGRRKFRSRSSTCRLQLNQIVDD